MCNSCSKPLTGSKYYDVIYRDARDHSHEEKIDEMQNKSRRSEEHEKEERISNYKKALMALDDDELNLIIENMKAQIAKLRAELENPEDKDRDTKQASVELIGIDNYHSVGVDGDTAVELLITSQNQRNRQTKSRHSKSYSVLTLDQNHNESKRGESLLQRMGSVD